MVDIRNVMRLELARLFRRSNILFFFLSVYVFITPIGRFSSSMSQKISTEDMFTGTIESMSIFALLLMSIFMINNIGNELNEGSYRKMLALGLDKRQYFEGKLFLILLIAFSITLLCVVVYCMLVIFVVDNSIVDILSGINLYGALHQFIGLSFIGLFGLSFIMVFRSRTVGLVFFPFWFFTEFFAFLMTKTKTNILIADYMPGVLGWSLHNNQINSNQQVLMLIIYSTIFITTAWYGLVLRDEKNT